MKAHGKALAMDAAPDLAMLKRKAEICERKAEEAANSNEPWAKGNLRTWQNQASQAWVEYYKAARAAGQDGGPGSGPQKHAGKVSRKEIKAAFSSNDPAAEQGIVERQVGRQSVSGLYKAHNREQTTKLPSREEAKAQLADWARRKKLKRQIGAA